MAPLDEQIRRHSAGAIIRHTSFQELLAYQNDFELTAGFIATWARPFYMEVGRRDDAAWVELMSHLLPTISKEVVVTLLGDFDWRTRQTGAYFAALKNYSDLLDIIGVHLLRSEVCYAGKMYTLVLASFNHAQSAEYLDRYLTYYLAQPDLWFDQTEAMQALAYLDNVNQTNQLAKHQDAWTSFLANKPHWSQTISTQGLESQLAVIREIQLTAAGPEAAM